MLPEGPEQLYLYSLVPVVSVATLLFFSAAFYARQAVGLTLYCFAVAAWSGTLAFAFFPPTAALGQRLVASGGFVAASYLHAAYDFTHQKNYALVWVSYAVAMAIFLLHLVWPGILYDPVALTAGPLFWPTMGLAFVAATIPLWQLTQAYRRAPRERKAVLVGLFAAGLLAYAGAWTNAFLLSYGHVSPVGMFIVLASLFALANVVREQQGKSARRLMDRSLTYSTLAAFLSAGFLFGVLSLMGGTEMMVSQYGLSAFFLLFMAAMAFEPLRQQIQEWLARGLLKDRVVASELARALTHQEVRADHAERLAELGALTTAVAHEVRNPLGVLSAQLKLLERTGGEPDAESLSDMRAQIHRAETFVDDLLRYGRPTRLEIREVDLGATAELAWSTARQGLDGAAGEVSFALEGFETPVIIEGDQGQLTQVLVILFENALLALAGRAGGRVQVTVTADRAGPTLSIEDNGPGLPDGLRTRAFEPFVSGRERQDGKTGTGLGLAIARGIVERHGGRIQAGRSALGGARFTLHLPKSQRLLSAAAPEEPTDA